VSASLTTNTPTSDTPLPTKMVSITIGSGPTAQSCSYTTGVSDGCTIPSLDQPTSNVTITTSFGGDVYDTPATVSNPATVTEPGRQRACRVHPQRQRDLHRDDERLRRGLLPHHAG
jgi:hypothetical protein